jgi:2-hydroxy-6-oxonona-2,4-dienedioate hydrolase
LLYALNKLLKNLLSDKENIRRRFVPVGKLRLFTLSSENQSFNGKPPLVLVQGLAIAARYWLPAIAELSKDFNVYAFDFPGWGKSDKPNRVLNIAELSDNLAAWTEAMRIDRAVFVGHSFGCQILADFALRHKRKIERIIFAAPTLDFAARNFSILFARSLLNARNEPWSLIHIAVTSLFEFGLVRQIKTLQIALRDRIEEKLPQIEIQTLVLRGERDTVVPQNWAETFAAFLPNAELAIIKNGTHGFNYSSPVQFAAAIREFLDRKL